MNVFMECYTVSALQRNITFADGILNYYMFFWLFCTNHTSQVPNTFSYLDIRMLRSFGALTLELKKCEASCFSALTGVKRI